MSSLQLWARPGQPCPQKHLCVGLCVCVYAGMRRAGGGRGGPSMGSGPPSPQCKRECLDLDEPEQVREGREGGREGGGRGVRPAGAS